MLLILLLFVTPSIGFRHQCAHQSRKSIITNLKKSHSIRWKTRSIPNPMRIYIHYEEAFNKLKDSEMLKKTLIRPAVKFWEETLKVKYPMKEPILLDRLCKDNLHEFDIVDNNIVKVCNISCIHETHNEHLQRKCYVYGKNNKIIERGENGVGVTNADLVILLDSGKYCKKNLLANAIEEKLESKYNRPIIGSLSICPDNLDLVSKYEEAIQTIKHEIMHILGFSVSQFAYFRDENGYPRTPRNANGDPSLGIFTNFAAYIPSNNTMIIFNQTEMTPIGERVREKAMLVTPNLMREAREYYNCSSLKGVLLEDYGEKSNAWSHFEMKNAYNELMAAMSSEETYLSRLTLALLEDSGWYHVDYTKAENFTFGKGLGCDFVNKNCFEYIHSQLQKRKSSSPWCKNVDENTCSEDRSLEQACYYEYGNNNLSDEYKYYKDKNIYSYDPYVDYCPMYLTFNKNSSLNLQCEKSDNIQLVEIPYNHIQSYGSSSKCFDSPFNSKLTVESCEKPKKEYINKGGCFKYRCSKQYGLMININEEEYSCFYEGDILNISTKGGHSLIKGTIKCPQCSDMCDKNLCTNVEKLVRYKFNNTRAIMKRRKDLNLECSGVKTNVASFSIILTLVILWMQRYNLVNELYM